MVYSIGQLAAATGVKAPTIRFYEQIGLLPSPNRTSANRRYYDAEDVKRLRFIRHARELGFEVSDIRSLIELSSQPQRSCEEADSIARKNLMNVERRISQLTLLKLELERMVQACGRGRIAECRVIESLEDHSLCKHHDEKR